MKNKIVAILFVLGILGLLLIGVLLGGCPPMSKQVRQVQQQEEKTYNCVEFIMPVPTSFLGDHCPRTDQRAEIVGGFVVCHCSSAPIDGGIREAR
jgi:hypothetical protein